MAVATPTIGSATTSAGAGTLRAWEIQRDVTELTCSPGAIAVEKCAGQQSAAVEENPSMAGKNLVYVKKFDNLPRRS